MEEIRTFIESVMAELGYGGIFLAAVVEVVFPPLPSDLLIPAAGVAAAAGVLKPEGVVLAATGGTVAGALILYTLARVAGEPIARRWIRRYGHWLGIREAGMDRSLQLFRRYGAPVLLFAHLIPGLRSGIAIPAGMSGMPLLPFSGLTALGAAIRATLQTTAGMLLAPHPLLLISTLFLIGAIIPMGLAMRALARRRPGGRLPGS